VLYITIERYQTANASNVTYATRNINLQYIYMGICCATFSTYVACVKGPLSRYFGHMVHSKHKHILGSCQHDLVKDWPIQNLLETVHYTVLLGIIFVFVLVYTYSCTDIMYKELVFIILYTQYVVMMFSYLVYISLVLFVNVMPWLVNLLSW